MARDRTLILLALPLVVAVALATSGGGALEPPSPLVGCRAVSHLLLRLVDCLVDACSLQAAAYKERSSSSSSSPSSSSSSSFERPVGSQLEIKLKEPSEEQPIDGGDNPLSAGAMGPVPAKREHQHQHQNNNNMNQMNQLNGHQDDADQDEHQDEQAEEWPFADDDKPESTHPMNWVPSESQTDHANVDSDQDSSWNQEQACWMQALEWLRMKLLVVRMRLLVGAADPSSVSEALATFEQLDQHLSFVCPNQTELDGLLLMGPLHEQDGPKQDPIVDKQPPEYEHGHEHEQEQQQPRANSDQLALDFILETIQVLAEIQDEVSEQLDRNTENGRDNGASKWSVDRLAVEAIKRHYSYLTQIITSYNLIFNAIDLDLMRSPRGRQPLL